MAIRSGNERANDGSVADLPPSRRHRARRAAAVLLGVSPPIICALLAGSDRWDLFERSGSITTAVGLLVASRRYLRHGVRELAMLHLTDELRLDAKELLEDILTGKLGLALSAFGTVVWGWGTYLRWWSFGYLAIWALFPIWDAYRDSVRVRRAGS
ncbi:MAG: hypothetical protein ACLQJR_33855 [Stellaceae bacterium]